MRHPLAFVIGMGVLALAGCHADGDADERQALAFATDAAPTTRADASLVDYDETRLAEGTKVGLFGSLGAWADATSQADVFYNQQATVGADQQTLSYSPLRFWPNSGEALAFWAYAPWNATTAPGARGEKGIAINTTDIPAAGGMGRITFTMAEKAAEQVDFMMTDLVAGCTKSDYPLLSDGAGGYAPKPVQLTFHHLLAQVRIYVDKQLQADGGQTWSDNVATSVELANIYTQGVLTPTYASASGKTTFAWSGWTELGASTVDAYDYTGITFVDGRLQDAGTEPTYATGYARGNVMMVIPQRLVDSNVPRIVVTFTDGTNTDALGRPLTASLTVNLIEADIEWLRGYIYSYAFQCRLKPGEHRVVGPEILTVTVSDTKTYQW